MFKIILLFAMIFIHCMLDFHQGDTIANMKQKSWWLKHPQYKDLYKYDYIAVLLVHGFSWSFAIQIPILLYNYKVFNSNDSWLLCVIIILINGLIHSFIDNAKANRLCINLVQDQIVHLIQIVGAWIAYFVIFYNVHM